MFQVNPLPSMKNQALFSSKDKSKKLKCRLLQFLFGALRVKVNLLLKISFRKKQKRGQSHNQTHLGLAYI